MNPPPSGPSRDRTALLCVLTAAGVWAVTLSVARGAIAPSWAGVVANLIIVALIYRNARELGRARAAGRRLARKEAGLRRLNAALREHSGRLSDSNLLLAELAATDQLTGLANRRRLDEALARAVEGAGHRSAPLSIVLLDVDHFKAFNDAFGHPAGDQILRDIAGHLLASVRPGEVAGRHGGEEYLVILPGTDVARSMRVAERLRRSIEGAGWPGRPVTVSLGVATLGPATPDAPSLVAAADRALYASKHRGRNHATHAEELTPRTTADRDGDLARSTPPDHPRRDARPAANRPVLWAIESL